MLVTRKRNDSTSTMEHIAITEHGLQLLVNKPAANEVRVTAFETELGQWLPDDYRTFLLRYNGGRPARRAFQFARSLMIHVRPAIHWFLSLHDGAASNLEHIARAPRGRIPPDTLPIANDPFGSYVLLGLAGEARSKIYFWDHERTAAAPPDWSTVDLVADRFDRFLRQLEPIHPRYT